MRVYTIQHISVLNKLQKKGQYRTDRRFMCFKEFKEAYEWYAGQARKRITGWTETRPIWVWSERPYIRLWKKKVEGKVYKKEQYVLLTLEVPDNEILLSNFDLWHFVLNRHVIPYEGKRTGSLKKSWERCFLISKKDLKPVVSQIGKIEYKNQGIIQNIKLTQLVSYKVFTVETFASPCHSKNVLN